MQTRPLGRTGLTVSRLALGCMSYGDAAWLEATFRKIFAGFVSGSVEGKITPFPLKLSEGIGVADTPCHHHAGASLRPAR